MGDSPHIAGVDIRNDIDFESILNTLNIKLNQKIKEEPHIAGVDILNDIDIQSTINTLNLTLNQKIKEEVEKQIAKTEQRLNSIWEQKIQRLLEVEKDYDEQIEKKLEEIKNIIKKGTVF